VVELKKLMLYCVIDDNSNEVIEFFQDVLKVLKFSNKSDNYKYMVVIEGVVYTF
jgi:hypothetical protein